MNRPNAPRINSVDFLKGIGIILVVLGHYPILIDSKLTVWIFAFHMPLFAFIGGIFYRVESIKNFTTNKIRRLLIPFFLWSLFFYILYGVIFYFTSPDLFAQQLKHIVYIAGGSGRNAVNGYANVTLWFLPFLASVSLIHLLLSKFNKNKWVEYGFVIIISLLGLLCGVLDIRLPYKINTAFTLYPFFWIGTRYLSQIRNIILEMSTERKVLVFISLIFIYIVSVIYNSGVDTASNSTGNYFLFYFGASAATIGLCFIAEKVNNIQFLNYIGKNSLSILIFHLPIILAITNLMQLIDISPSLVTNIVVLLFTIMICLVIGEILRRYSPMLLGEKRLQKERT